MNILFEPVVILQPRLARTIALKIIDYVAEHGEVEGFRDDNFIGCRVVWFDLDTDSAKAICYTADRGVWTTLTPIDVLTKVYDKLCQE